MGEVIGCSLTPAGLFAGSAYRGWNRATRRCCLDVLDVDATDYHIQVGPVYFNFQVNPDLDETWTLEHIYYLP